MEIESTAQDLTIEYRGIKGPLFRIALKNALLTFLTLGVYRFWAKTRIRKYFWSATAPGGDPLEYNGTGLEKLLGFLIAVAFLAVYLGLLQVLLSFVGLSFVQLGDDPEDVLAQVAVTYITLFAILPFIFYAQYRARRYILSRTRWRGIRFGVDQAAWGYVWRAIMHILLTIFSLGLLLPRQTFWLEKYKVDRTWYGNAKFRQNGRWQILYPAMKHLFIAFGLIIGGGVLMAITESPVLVVFIIAGSIWIYYGAVYYSVRSFQILADNKQLGDEVGFETKPRPVKVFWTFILGSLLASTCAGLFFSAFLIVAIYIIGDVEALETIFDPLTGFNPGTAEIIAISLAVIGYLLMLLMYGVFAMIFVTQPILEHYVTNTRIINAPALHEIEQRSRDEMVEAEGFADALDVGAAI